MNDKDHYHSFMLKFPDEYRNRPSHPPGSPPGSACSSTGLLRRSVGGYLAPRPLRAHPARLPRRRRPFPPLPCPPPAVTASFPPSNPSWPSATAPDTCPSTSDGLSVCPACATA